MGQKVNIIAPVNERLDKYIVAALSQEPVSQTNEATDGVDYVALAEDSLSVQLDPKDSSQLTQDEQEEQLTSLKDHIQVLEDYNEELTAQLAESETKATRMHEIEQERTNLLQNTLSLCQSRATEAEQARAIEQATIVSIQNDLATKENMLQSKQEAHNATTVELSVHHKLHQIDVATWESKVVDLQQSNNALICEMRELVTKNESECKNDNLLVDLQNELHKTKEKEVEHNLQLATVKADFHNANNSLDVLLKEKQTLKGDIESLKSSTDVNRNRNFEKEMNAAHSRFVSMEKALEDRVLHLEREKVDLHQLLMPK